MSVTDKSVVVTMRGGVAYLEYVGKEVEIQILEMDDLEQVEEWPVETYMTELAWLRERGLADLDIYVRLERLLEKCKQSAQYG